MREWMSFLLAKVVGLRSKTNPSDDTRSAAGSELLCVIFAMESGAGASSAESGGGVGSAENPSYQNYLANQLLLSMKPSASSQLSYEDRSRNAASLECSEKLGSLLDVIDSIKPQTTTEAGQQQSIYPPDISSPYDWIKHFDATHGQFYYYNYKTGISQWEEPENFIEPVIVAPLPSSSAEQNRPLTSEAMTGYAATFNAKTGAFSTAGTGTHWDNVGRPNDREGRQLAGRSAPSSSRLSIPSQRTSI
jgi:hypothetical protein